MAPGAPAPRQVTVEVDEDGNVRASTPEGERSRRERVRLDGVDEQLVHVLDRRLARTPTGWERDDLRAFGGLLFRCLLDGDAWQLVVRTWDALLDGQRLRLRLAFPATPAGRQLAALPWEYLHVPDGPGGFLGTEDPFLVSRTVPADVRAEPSAPRADARVLLVVSRPTDEADVVAEDVEALVDGLPGRGPVAVEHLLAPTPRALEKALAAVRPDVLHVVAHGRHEAAGDGRLALVDVAGTAAWLSGQEVARVVASSGARPRLVLLQSCVGGKEDPAASSAGTASQMVRHGLPCVLGLRYDVRPEVATGFADRLYAALLEGEDVDAAAQRARRYLADPTSPQHDPRLIGLPAVHAQDRAGALGPVLVGAPAADGTGGR